MAEMMDLKLNLGHFRSINSVLRYILNIIKRLSYTEVYIHVYIHI